MKFLSILLLLPFAAMAASGLPDKPFVSAEGMGTISVPPDGVNVMVEVIGSGQTASEAFKQSSDKIGRLVNAVESIGLPENAIVASDLSVGQDMQRVDGEYVSVGYEARRSMTIEVRDMKKVSALLDALLQADVSQISHIQRFVDDEEAVKAKVLELAVIDARRRAEHYAKLQGRELGEVWWVGDDVSLTRQMNRESLPMAAYMQSPGTPFFSAGDIEFSQPVEVIYLLD
ncbi:MAG TPA: SIMPL domain-containing protein [Gammaproteobacteria bacterium]